MSFCPRLLRVRQYCPKVKGEDIVERDSLYNTGLSKKMDGIWNRYNLKSTVRIYMFGVLNIQKSLKF